MSRNKQLSPAGEQIAPILGSSTFEHAPRLRKLLAYLWERRAEDPTEYAIGVDALDRGTNFDPKTDSTVRVHTMRLRQKLAEYYAKEAPEALERVTIAEGGYRIRIQELATKQPAPVRRSFGIMWAVSALIPLALSVFLIAENWRLRQAAASPARQAMHPFWRHVLGKVEPIQIVLPNPLFFKWGEDGIRVRHADVNDMSELHESAALADLIRKWGPPEQVSSYSVMGDTIASGRLIGYFAGRGVAVAAVAEGSLSLDFHGNKLFLGLPRTSRHVGRYGAQSALVLTDKGDKILNRSPREGEPSEYAMSTPGLNRRVLPMLLKVVPGEVAGTKVIVLGGHSSALASYLTTADGLNEIGARLQREGRPEYFEAAIMAEMDGATVVRASLKNLRPFSSGVSR